MYLLTVVVVSPSINLSRLRDSEAMESAHGDVDDLLAPKTFDHRWLPDVLVRSVAKPEVITLAPGPDKS